MSETKAEKIERPLSPHLQVYRPQMTSMLSILHRMTGVALAVGTILFVWLLVATASGEDAFNTFMSVVSSPIGMVALAGWSFALFYHMCNGVRHLIWDTGRLFKIQYATSAGYIVLLSSITLTAFVWYMALA